MKLQTQENSKDDLYVNKNSISYFYAKIELKKKKQI